MPLRGATLRTDRVSTWPYPIVHAQSCASQTTQRFVPLRAPLRFDVGALRDLATKSTASRADRLSYAARDRALIDMRERSLGRVTASLWAK